jgi:hypothetical protein
MRGIVLGLVLPMALAGCVWTAEPREPERARLSAEVLTLILRDGTVCRADWAASGGAGRLEPCGPGFDYRVAVVEDPNILRQLWTGLTDALDVAENVPPMAQVVITDAMGREFVFVSPPPVE